MYMCMKKYIMPINDYISIIERVLLYEKVKIT